MNEKTTFKGWQEVFANRRLSYFLIGWIILGVLGNTVFTVFYKLFSETYWALLAIGVLAAASLWITIAQIRKRLQTNTAKLLADQKQPEKNKGLIILVSRFEPSQTAINYHLGQLEFCWLICSNSSQPIGNRLQQEYTDKVKEIEIVTVTDKEVYEPLVFKKKIEEIYANKPHNLKDEEIILDFTGMTSLASVGSLLACLGSKRTIQYIPAATTSEELDAISSLSPIQIKFDLKSVNS